LSKDATPHEPQFRIVTGEFIGLTLAKTEVRAREGRNTTRTAHRDQSNEGHMALTRKGGEPPVMKGETTRTAWIVLVSDRTMDSE